MKRIWTTALALLLTGCLDESGGEAEGEGVVDAVGRADGADLDAGARAGDAERVDAAQEPEPDAAPGPELDAAPERDVAPRPDAAPPVERSGRACPPAERAGGFLVERREAFSTVGGAVRDGVPAHEMWPVLEQLGDCALRVAPALDCGPGCELGEVCGFDGCEPEPVNLSAGTVRVDGLTAPVEMEPAANGFYTFRGDLPHPAFEAGDPIALNAAGDAVPAFELSAHGVPALEVPAEPIAGSGAGPVVVSWTPSADPDAARVRVVLEVGHHGGYFAELECDVPDNGAYAVPRALADALYAQGVAGFPVVEITRYTADSIELDGGCVDLQVLARATLDLDIDGVDSCSDDADCAPGQACGGDLLCAPDPDAADAGAPEADAAVPDLDAGVPEPDMAPPEPDMAPPEPDMAPPEPDMNPPEPELPPFSFFVTSLEAMRELSGSQDGFGGDLGGLEGADTICQRVAEMSGAPGADQKTWRAFLSTARGGENDGPINAIDRIGDGPWYDRNGRLFAMSRFGLVSGDRPVGDPQIIDDLPNERGEGLEQFGDTHDVLTGSDATGRFQGGGAGDTCNDWTSAVGRTGRPFCGHSWPARSGTSWIRAHRVRGCSPGVNLIQNGPGRGDCVGCGGGWGAIYCFALTP